MPSNEKKRNETKQMNEEWNSSILSKYIQMNSPMFQPEDYTPRGWVEAVEYTNRIFAEG